MNWLLQADGLCKTFTRSASRSDSSFNAVDGVSFTLEEGGRATVSGHSGSGKTTLLTLLAGLARPTSGTVLFKGLDIHAMKDADRARILNSELSFMPQGAGLLGNLTVLDNIRSPQMFGGRDGTGLDRAEYLLETVGLSHLASELPRSLSGGERRRVALARALFNRPSLLMADEPTSDLDPENTAIVMDLLGKASKHGTAVLLVTHDAAVAAFGSRRYSMEHGRLAPAGA